MGLYVPQIWIAANNCSYPDIYINIDIIYIYIETHIHPDVTTHKPRSGRRHIPNHATLTLKPYKTKGLGIRVQDEHQAPNWVAQAFPHQQFLLDPALQAKLEIIQRPNWMAIGFVELTYIDMET